MKIMLLFILSFTPHLFYSQYGVGIVNDTSGYINVRSSPKIGENVIDSIASGIPVYCYDREGNWIPVEFYQDHEVAQGYIYFNRIQFIDFTFDELPMGSPDANYRAFKIDSITIQVSSRNISVDELTIEPCDSTTKWCPPTINGKEFWGTDGGYPSQGYEKIVINSNVYDYRTDELSQYFSPSLGYMKCIKIDDLIYLIGHNGDGAAAYTVVWTIYYNLIIDHRMFYGF